MVDKVADGGKGTGQLPSARRRIPTIVMILEQDG
jgi:hypothetical protein